MAAAKSERQLLKRIAAINQFVEQGGERPIVEALAYQLRASPQTVFQERQQLNLGYGQYAALRGLSYLGRGSIKRIFDDYRRGRPWSEITDDNGLRLSDLMSWIGELARTTNRMATQSRTAPGSRFGP